MKNEPNKPTDFADIFQDSAGGYSFALHHRNYEEAGGPKLPEDCVLWVALMEVAQRDIRSLQGRYDVTSGLHETIFALPGFVLAAHIGADVVRYYLYRFLLPLGVNHDIADMLIKELLELFQRRKKLPMPWDVGELKNYEELLGDPDPALD